MYPLRLCRVHITLDSFVIPKFIASTQLLEVGGVEMVLEYLVEVSMQWNCLCISCISEAESQLTFKLVAMVANRTNIGNIDLILVGSVKVVSTFRLPITQQSFGAFHLIGQDPESNSFILVAVVTYGAKFAHTNLCQVGCVKVILAALPVAVYI